MSQAIIPPIVLHFILKKIDTVAELETLLIMSTDEQRRWSIDDIAARIYAPTPSAAAVLHSILKKGLIDSDHDGHYFRFSPSSDEERLAVQQTAIAYRANLIPIATLIHNKASVPVQEFARAFNLKTEE